MRVIPEIGRTGRPLCGENFQRRVLFVSAEPVVNALMRELTHMVFGLQRSCEGTIGEHGMETRVKIDMTLPSP